MKHPKLLLGLIASLAVLFPVYAAVQSPQAPVKKTTPIEKMTSASKPSNASRVLPTLNQGPNALRVFPAKSSQRQQQPRKLVTGDGAELWGVALASSTESPFNV